MRSCFARLLIVPLHTTLRAALCRKSLVSRRPPQLRALSQRDARPEAPEHRLLDVLRGGRGRQFQQLGHLLPQKLQPTDLLPFGRWPAAEHHGLADVQQLTCGYAGPVRAGLRPHVEGTVGNGAAAHADAEPVSFLGGRGPALGERVGFDGRFDGAEVREDSLHGDVREGGAGREGVLGGLERKVFQQLHTLFGTGQVHVDAAAAGICSVLVACAIILRRRLRMVNGRLGKIERALQISLQAFVFAYPALVPQSRDILIIWSRFRSAAPARRHAMVMKLLCRGILLLRTLQLLAQSAGQELSSRELLSQRVDLFHDSARFR